MIRKIIKIDKERFNGCGACAGSSVYNFFFNTLFAITMPSFIPALLYAHLLLI